MDGTGGYAIGIDCGSTLCKGVLLSANRIEAVSVLPTGWDLQESASRVLAELTNAVGAAGALSDTVADIPVIATGYGRDTVRERTGAVTEISAHARGAGYLMPETRTVIDIGGQDCKVIAVEKGRVTSFQMNDKCAAGTGRFVQMILERFKADLSLMDELLAAEKSIQLNSTCAVFAESEIIGLLAKGHSREEIVGGVALSLAVKISSLAARVGLHSPAVLSGGLAESTGIRRALSQVLNIDVQFLPQGLYAGAIGAACMGLSL
ncbi:2-hydroxyglutaryl-CoA dehydratase [Spirochaetia bacterium]|nr:2-hydroxyglutaryl-CoA dehydratase [Spirochaetia bacterium]